MRWVRGRAMTHPTTRVAAAAMGCGPATTASAEPSRVGSRPSPVDPASPTPSARPLLIEPPEQSRARAYSAGFELVAFGVDGFSGFVSVFALPCSPVAVVAPASPLSAAGLPSSRDVSVDRLPGAVDALRSFFAQPVPLKWIAGAANAFRSVPSSPHAGQNVGVGS